MDITVPVGSTATVYVPAESQQSITESGKNIQTSAGVAFQRMEAGYAVFSVGSGEYSFEVNNK
jgi:hypothetical protein